MISLTVVRNLVIGAALAVAPAASYGGVFISVGFAPPVLPVYAQPICPNPGYIWTPGYWAYAPAGYYWVPGVWVEPPQVGYLWTPPYWGFEGGRYGFHEGYWGSHVGFYGGVNYGFGYGGIGFVGGRWNGGVFEYNTAVARVGFGGGFGHVYNDRTVVLHNTIINNNHYSYNGGNGIQARPTGQELAAEHEQHIGRTQNQTEHFQNAQNNRANFASANGGHPQYAAQQRIGTTAGAVPARGFQGGPARHIGTPAQGAASNPARNGFGTGSQVNTRQGNQGQRISQGVNSGQLTRGETRNLDNRDARIQGQAQADRQANGGNLTNNQRQQINNRQNRVSNSINQDKHNANNDASAAARQGRSAQQEQNRAGRAEQNHAPEKGGEGHGSDKPR